MEDVEAGDRARRRVRRRAACAQSSRPAPRPGTAGAPAPRPSTDHGSRLAHARQVARPQLRAQRRAGPDPDRPPHPQLGQVAQHQRRARPAHPGRLHGQPRPLRRQSPSSPTARARGSLIFGPSSQHLRERHRPAGIADQDRRRRRIGGSRSESSGHGATLTRARQASLVGDGGRTDLPLPRRRGARASRPRPSNAGPRRRSSRYAAGAGRRPPRRRRGWSPGCAIAATRSRT